MQDLESKDYIPFINLIVKSLKHLFVNFNKDCTVNSILEFFKNNFMFKFLEFLDFKSV